MGISCNGICQRYKARKPLRIGRYASGQKRCNSCDVFMNWDGLWCPCCNYRLRQSPRSGKYKEKYLQIKKREAISFGL